MSTVSVPNVRFGWPESFAVESSGVVFVADTGNQVIRRVEPDGRVSTIAGSAGKYGTVDGTGGDARFSSPRRIVGDGAGAFYVAEWASIRRVTASGIVTTLAGGSYGTSDGRGVAASFRSVTDIAVGRDGRLYVLDLGRLRLVTRHGIVTTVPTMGEDDIVSGLHPHAHDFQGRAAGSGRGGGVVALELAQPVDSGGATRSATAMATACRMSGRIAVGLDRRIRRRGQRCVGRPGRRRTDKRGGVGGRHEPARAADIRHRQDFVAFRWPHERRRADLAYVAADRSLDQVRERPGGVDSDSNRAVAAGVSCVRKWFGGVVDRRRRNRPASLSPGSVTGTIVPIFQRRR